MKYRLQFYLVLLVLVLQTQLGVSQTQTGAQQPSPAAPQISNPRDDDDVVRITTNLVQFDVTVTDKEGRPVPDLKPEDFEILENDRAQKISNFSYISLAPNANAASLPPPPIDKNGPPIPPARLRPEQVRRTIALVVDDLQMSFESVAYVRSAIKKFIDTEMQPGDLVAIVRTSGGIGGLQQFSSDKRLLMVAMDRIRWHPLGRGGVGAFSPLIAAGPQMPTDESDANDPDGDEGEFREQLFSAGTLGALNYIVRGLRELPGRKSVVLMSDGFRLMRSNGTKNDLTFDRLRRLTDLANRASVVVYTMDARGLVSLGPTAADDASGMSAGDIRRVFSDRSKSVFDTQFGLSFLAKETGGFAIRNNNDLAGGLKRILADQNGYYLIGYQPDVESFDPKRLRYNSFKVKVKRKDLVIRYRSGFYGIADEKAVQPPPPTRGQMMVSALMSPFNADETQIQLTSVFGNDAQTGSYTRSFLFIKTKDLTFVPDPAGGFQTTFDLLAITVGDDGFGVDQVSRTYTIHLRDQAFERALKAGFVYVETVPIKKPGAYQLRIAVRDTASNRIGSASQFIEVPDLKKKRMVLSGVIAYGQDATAALRGPAVGAQKVENAVEEENPEAGVAVRRIRSGMILRYGCFIYNAKIDKQTARPQLQTQVRLFREAVEVFAGAVTPYDAGGQTDPQRLPFGGAMRLGSVLTPGEYVLQIVVTDLLAKENQKIATQWITFDIVPSTK